MKLQKIISFLCAASIIMAQGVVSVSSIDVNESGSSAQEQTEKISVSVVDLSTSSDIQSLATFFIDNTIVNDKEYDGTKNAAFTFTDNVGLSGIEAGDEVWLTADATFVSVTADTQNNKNVTLKNFRLAGNDADKYELNIPSNFSVKKLSAAKINPRIITFSPEEPDATYNYTQVGQQIDYQYDKTAILEDFKFNQEMIKLTLVYQPETGQYAYEYETFTENPNYIFVFQCDTIPTVEDIRYKETMIRLVNENNPAYTLSQDGETIYSNGNVLLTMTACSKEKLAKGMQFWLYENGKPIGTPIIASNGSDKGEEYEYTAQCTLQVDDTTNRKMKDFQCYFRKVDEENFHTQDLDLYTKGSTNPANNLILDTISPTAENISVQYNFLSNGDYRHVRVEGIASDGLSGVKEVAFQWDTNESGGYNDKTKVTDTGSFEWVVPYDKLKHAVENGVHTLYLKITDYAGNTFITEGNTYCEDTDGMDTTPPVVNSVSMNAFNNAIIDNIFRTLFGVSYYQEYLRISISAQDKSESKKIAGISKVAFLSGANILFEQEKTEDDIYFYDIDTDQKIQNLSVRLTDRFGNVSDIFPLSDYSIDGKNPFPKTIITDKTPPSISIGEKKDLYGVEEESIRIHISDANLQNVVISNGDSFVNKWENADAQTAYDYEIHTVDFTTGSYIFTVQAEDKAGNSSVSECRFSVDKKLPEVRSELISHEIKTADEKKWIRETTNKEGNINPLIIRVYPKQTGSQLEKIVLKVNGNIHEERKLNDIGEAGYTDFSIPADNKTNKYRIESTVYSASGNHETSEAVFYIDRYNPVIETFLVADPESLLDKFITILPFGIFYHTNIRLIVSAKEDENDSGIDYLELMYDGLEKPCIMTETEQDGQIVYEYTIPFDTQIFNSHITVTAYDKAGHHSSELPSVANTDPDNRETFDTNFIMIENIPPEAETKMPDSDYQNEKEYWFNGTDRDIIFRTADKQSGIRKTEVLFDGKRLTEDADNKKLTTIETSASAVSPLTEEEAYRFSIKQLSNNRDGKHHIQTIVTDNAGNVSKSDNIIFYLDTTQPEITAFHFTEEKKDSTDQLYSPFDENQNIVRTDYGYYFKEKFYVSVEATDQNASSGLRSALISMVPYLEDGNFGEVVSKTVTMNGNVSQSIEIPQGFKGMIYAFVTDNTGNKSETKTPRSFVSDNEAPLIVIEKLPNTTLKDAVKSALYTDDIAFRVTVTDKKSGLRELSHETISSGNHYTHTDSTNISDNYDHTYQIGDDMGNGWIIKEMDLNLVTSAERIFTYGETGDDSQITVSVSAQDNAGNKDVKSAEPFTIDRTAPVVSEISLVAKDNRITRIPAKDFLSSDRLLYGYYFNEPVTVMAYCEDKEPSSGLHQAEIRLVHYQDGKKTKEETENVPINEGVAEIKLTSGFKGQIYITPYDNTLNVLNNANTIVTRAPIIENNPPQIIITDMSVPAKERDDAGNLLYNKGAVQFKVTIRDTVSGLHKIAYHTSADINSTKETVLTISDEGNSVGDKLGNTDWTITGMDQNLVTEVSCIFHFSKDDKNIYMTFYATDRCGNRSEDKESDHFTIDTHKPAVSKLSLYDNNTSKKIQDIDSSEFIQELSYGYFFKESFTLTAECYDNIPSSGLKQVAFLFVPYENGQKVTNQIAETPYIQTIENIKIGKVISGKASCTVEKGFKGQIFVTAYDYAAYTFNSNLSDTITAQAYVVEDTAPEIAVQALPDTKLIDDKGNKLYTNAVSMNVTVTDKKSGLNLVSYSIASDTPAASIAEKSQSLAVRHSDYKVGYVFPDTGWKIEEMDNNLITKISRSFTVNEDDKNIILTIKAEDQCGNKTDPVKSERFTIDRQAPTVEAFSFEPASVDGLKQAEKDGLYQYVRQNIESFDYGYYFNDDFNAIVTLNDHVPSSGLKNVRFRFVPYENGKTQEEFFNEASVNGNSATCKVERGFKGQIYACVYDNADNQSEEQRPDAFVAENDVPVITIEKLPATTYTDGNNPLYIGSVSFRVTIKDEASGLRHITYTQKSEKEDTKTDISIVNSSEQYKKEAVLEDGWIIEKMDKNLITQVYKVFTFDRDDNNISLSFMATDRSNNTSDEQKTSSFTIDKTPPTIVVSCQNTPQNGNYYQKSVTFIIEVTERNFDSRNMIGELTDSYKNNNVKISYQSSSSLRHTAMITLPEGDYQFNLSGTDRGNHRALITDNIRNTASSSTSFTYSFYVDDSAPEVTTNFNSFNQEYFREDNLPEISLSVKEHNFNTSVINSYVHLQYKQLPSGTEHNEAAFAEQEWRDVYNIKWTESTQEKDVFSVVCNLNQEYRHMFSDGVYQLRLLVQDPAGNAADVIESQIFEIDRILPQFVKRGGIQNSSASYGDSLPANYIEFYDQKSIQEFQKKNDGKSPVPFVEFADVNFEKIVYSYQTYCPNYEDAESQNYTNIDYGNKKDEKSETPDIMLDNFNRDGVYVYQFIVYDKAGNEYKAEGTYFRMDRAEILTYIKDSDAENHTGYYRFQEKNGDRISTKAANIPDIPIVIIVPKSDMDKISVTIESEETKTEEEIPDKYLRKGENGGVTQISENAVQIEWIIENEYFSDKFKEATVNEELDLYVSVGETRWPLTKIKIDTQEPEITVPEWYKDWGIKNLDEEIEVNIRVSEQLAVNTSFDPQTFDSTKTNITDNNNIVEYTYNPDEQILSFKLTSGFHKVEVTFVDMAGNTKSHRVNNFIVGKIMMFIIIGIVLALIVIITVIIIVRKKRSS